MTKTEPNQSVSKHNSDQTIYRDCQQTQCNIRQKNQLMFVAGVTA